MALRPALQWNKNKMTGFEKLPQMPNNERINSKMATEVILFMFSAVNDELKIPIAYFFTAPTKSLSRHLIANNVMKAILQCGVHLTSITFDGHTSNPGVCTAMGANLDVYSEDFHPSICVNNTNINIVLDPSHMMKMFRNVLGTDLLFLI